MRANLGPEKQLTLTEIHWIGEGNAKRWPSMRNSLGELLSLKVFYDVGSDVLFWKKNKGDIKKSHCIRFPFLILEVLLIHTMCN